jgi:hypothetical protein
MPCGQRLQEHTLFGKHYGTAAFFLLERFMVEVTVVPNLENNICVTII